MNQPGFFDIQSRTSKLTQMGDPLVGLNRQIDWEAFRSDLGKVHAKPRKSKAGAKPIDVVLMFKLLVLQHACARSPRSACPTTPSWVHL
jgi:IS5 family transposase